MFGKLDFSMLPTDPIIITAAVLMVAVALLILILITVMGRWGWLWREWLTTVDHKKIGIMYVILAIIALARGIVEAVMMRLQQVIATSSDGGFLNPHHFDQNFTAHGILLLIFMAMPLLSGLINLVVPLQIGARDVAFPFMNALSFWLTAAGFALMNMSLVIGEFATAGWLAYMPLADSVFLPSVGMDYYIWSVTIAGIASTLMAVNIFATIIKMRAPGMTFMKMPIFTWSIFNTTILIMAAFPPFTVALLLLYLDRHFGTHFFTSEAGGNPMMLINLEWIWGHPEVYILVMPAFGIFSEVASTFSRKKLFGYTTMVWALGVINFLSFIVWAHHFFTMGAGPNVNAFFGIATMVIAIPTGVKIFNWLFTMYRGQITFTAPMLFLVGFIITFTFGGMTGVMLSIPALDFQYHNSLFLVAHFHNTIIGGVVFGYLAGLMYWFPKFMGFKLNDTLGKASFWCWIIGFFVAFTPLYALGLLGAARRKNFHELTDYAFLYQIGLVGALILALAVVLIVVQLVWSIINHKKYAVGNDPWDARTLEWSTSSPPPFYNFALVPHIEKRDDFWYKKQENKPIAEGEITDIHMPRNSAIPILISGAAFLMMVGFIFYVHWLWVVGAIGLAAFWLRRVFDNDTDYYVTKEEVAAIEAKLKGGAHV